ncbi:MAG: peptide transporter ATP-binding protein [Deltaproteobacteria bacterium]|nr:peptide transporter ATP-binding protein [Deltaproteobacteria bacterium]
MTELLLETRNLRKMFAVSASPFSRAKQITAAEGINISLAAGETLGIAGESGCGKSTVAKMLMGLLPPTSGEIIFCGRQVSTFTAKEQSNFRGSVQMIFQDPFSSLNPRMRVGEIIGEPLLIHRTATGKDLEARVLQLMEQVGLAPEQYARYPHQFSGGQRQRIGIARALAVNPKLLIADEPLSALDISIQAQIINLLIELRKKRGLTYILISHDLSVIRHLSDKTAVMYLGRIVEEGATADIFASPLHPYTEALLAAIPGLSGKRCRAPGKVLQGDIPSPLAPPSGCHFHPRCPYKRELCATQSPVLEDKGENRKAACHFSREIFS